MTLITTINGKEVEIDTKNPNDKNILFIRNEVKKISRLDIRQLENSKVFAFWVMYKSNMMDREMLKEMVKDSLNELKNDD